MPYCQHSRDKQLFRTHTHAHIYTHEQHKGSEPHTCIMGLNRAIKLGNSSTVFSCSNQSWSVFKYFTLSFASWRALKTSLHSFAKGVQYVDLFASKNRNTCHKKCIPRRRRRTANEGRKADERTRHKTWLVVSVACVPCEFAHPAAAQKSN